MEHTHEMERWRLELELHKLRDEISALMFLEARLTDYLHAHRIGGPAMAAGALASLQTAHAAYIRDRYPDDRP
jgi:hypothetical protein